MVSKRYKKKYICTYNIGEFSLNSAIFRRITGHRFKRVLITKKNMFLVEMNARNHSYNVFTLHPVGDETQGESL